MLGWLTGDGVFSKDTVALVFGPTERRAAEALVSELNELKASCAIAAGETVRQCNIYTQRNGVHQTTTSQTSLVGHLESVYGFSRGTATHREYVPSAVHNVADDLKIAYLQGLFCPDGCIRRNNGGVSPEVMLASSAPELLRSVRLLFPDLGMTVRITWMHPLGRTNPQGQLHLFNPASAQLFVPRRLSVLAREGSPNRRNPQQAVRRTAQESTFTEGYLDRSRREDDGLRHHGARDTFRDRRRLDRS